MIIPELKALFSPDLPNAQLPDDPDDCLVLVEAEIGKKGVEGADNFSFTVATPRALARDSGNRWGRGYLIVDSFSWETVRHSLERLFAQCWRETWEEVAYELGKNLHWEFENYKKSKEDG